jgi:carbonic anhydrase
MAVESMVHGGALGPDNDCPNLDRILRDIQESVDPSWHLDWGQISGDARQSRIDQVSRQHVQRTLRTIREQSAALARLAQTGRIKIVGGIYDVHSGVVDFFE